MHPSAFQSVRIIFFFVFLELTLPVLDYISDINVHQNARSDVNRAQRLTPPPSLGIANTSDPYYACTCTCVATSASTLNPLIAQNRVCQHNYMPSDGRMCGILMHAQLDSSSSCDVYAVMQLIAFTNAADGTTGTTLSGGSGQGTCTFALDFASVRTKMLDETSDLDRVTKAILGVLVISGVAHAFALFLRTKWTIADLRKGGGGGGGTHRRIEVDYAMHILQDGPQVVMSLLYLSLTGAPLGTNCLECIAGTRFHSTSSSLNPSASCTFQSTPGDNLAVLLSIVASGLVVLKTSLVIAWNQYRTSSLVGTEPTMWIAAGLVVHSLFLIGPICGAIYFDDNLIRMFGVGTSGERALLVITIISVFVHVVCICKLVYAALTGQMPAACVTVPPTSSSASIADITVSSEAEEREKRTETQETETRKQHPDAEANLAHFMTRYGAAAHANNNSNNNNKGKGKGQDASIEEENGFNMTSV